MDQVKKVLYDSTILLGAYLADGPQRERCRAALALATEGRVRGHVCDSALGEVADELFRAAGRDATRDEIAQLRAHLEVLSADGDILDACLKAAETQNCRYLDDAITMQCAAARGIDLIVTLNTSDFTTARTRAAAPETLLASLPPLTEHAGAA